MPAAHCLSASAFLSPMSTSLEEWQKHFTVSPDKILFQDEEVVAFGDRSPAASVHILIVPRHARLRGVESLTSNELPLLSRMSALGAQLTNCDSLHMGYHQAPLRSVPHLHLHCMVPPFRPRWKKMLYTELCSNPSHGFISHSSITRRLSAPAPRR